MQTPELHYSLPNCRPKTLQSHTDRITPHLCSPFKLKLSSPLTYQHKKQQKMYHQQVIWLLLCNKKPTKSCWTETGNSLFFPRFPPIRVQNGKYKPIILLTQSRQLQLKCFVILLAKWCFQGRGVLANTNECPLKGNARNMSSTARLLFACMYSRSCILQRLSSCRFWRGS